MRSSPGISFSRSAASSVSISSSTDDQSLEVEAFDEPELFGLGELFEEVGEPLVVHDFGELAAVMRGERSHRGGDVTRVHVTKGRDLGGDGGRVEERLHLGPVDDPDRALATQGARAGAERNCGDLPLRRLSRDFLQREIVHVLGADSLVEHVLGDQQLARPLAEVVEVDRRAAQASPFGVERGDAMCVDEEAPPLAARHEAEDAGRIVAVGRREDDVFDPAERGPVRVEQRQTSDAERVDQVARHARNLPADHPWTAGSYRLQTIERCPNAWSSSRSKSSSRGRPIESR